MLGFYPLVGIKRIAMCAEDIFFPVSKIFLSSCCVSVVVLHRFHYMFEYRGTRDDCLL